MSNNAEYAIKINSLVKDYGSNRAVDHISFEVPFGVIFAFLGPNGAGKTTTVEMLECLRKPSGGAAYVLGLNIAKNQNEIRKRIGVLPQEFNTFDRLTVRETLKYYATLYDNSRDIDELIRSVDLVDKAKTQYKDLSGGLQQRLGVAIALVNNPEIVFLDEPTEGLDPKARRSVWKVIKELKEKGKTVFLTTHYMEEAEELADIVAIIFNGKIKAMDSPEGLITRYCSRGRLTIRGGGPRAFNVLKRRWQGTELTNGDVSVPLNNKHDLATVVELLDKLRIPYDDIEMKRPSLEDVFLDLTETDHAGA